MRVEQREEGETVREEAEWGGKAVIFHRHVKSLKISEQNV